MKSLRPLTEKIFSLRVIQRAYHFLLQPRSYTEDDKRHELIFNVIISTIISTLLVLECFVIYNTLTYSTYTGISIILFTSIVLFFCALFILSRKGYFVLASYIFISFYFICATYGIYKWSIELPLAVLSFAVLIVISSILISTRFSFIITGSTVVVFVLVGYMETHGIIETNLAWRTHPLEWKDAFEASFFYLSIMVVSWLSNRDLEKSLIRARSSELDLKKERDLLEIRIEERTRELKNAQLEKMSQMYRFVEFGRSASGIFHDILNPLTTMSLTVEKINTEHPQKSIELQEQIERAFRASKKIESFIQTAKKQLDSEGGTEFFIIEQEIQDAIDLLLHKSRTRGVELLIVHPTKTEIYGNSVKFFQIVSNLISNAIDAYADMPKTKNTYEVLISVHTENDFIIITVRDFGRGMTEELQTVIFDPFFTTKSKKQGMGLGLSSTKSLVEKDFKGTIGCTSSLGKGSTFYVKIPRTHKR